MRTPISIMTVSLLLAVGPSIALAAPAAAPVASVGAAVDAESFSVLTTMVCADPSTQNLAKMKAALEALAAQSGRAPEAAQALQKLASCASSLADNPKGALALASLVADTLLNNPDVLLAAKQAGMVSAIKADLDAVKTLAAKMGEDVAALEGQLEQIALTESTDGPTAAGGGGDGGGPPAFTYAPVSVPGSGGQSASPSSP